MPASPPRFGAQARIHGLMTELARRHDISAFVLIDDEFDADESRKAMREYCREVLFVPNPHSSKGIVKRRLQLKAVTSTLSYERLRTVVPEVQEVLDRVLCSTPFDIVNLEFSFLGHCNLRQAPPGGKVPAVFVDSHNIDYELARQYASAGGLFRRAYASVNWRKLRREELQTYRDADGVYLCSADDEQRLLKQVPSARTAVIPNAADVEYYQPRPSDPPPDGRTVVFFGLLSYVPNIDGVAYFIQEIWPRIAEANPDARFKVIGGNPHPSLLAMAGPRIEFTGFVPDLRPHLAAASVVVVPLRLGGGTRLKIVEAMAMGKAIVSTTLGAEGIDTRPPRDLLLEDDPAAFAAAVNGLLADPDRATRIGQAARQLAVERYSWKGAASELESFYRQILERRV